MSTRTMRRTIGSTLAAARPSVDDFALAFRANKVVTQLDEKKNKKNKKQK